MLHVILSWHQRQEIHTSSPDCYIYLVQGNFNVCLFATLWPCAVHPSIMKQILSITSIHAILLNIRDHRDIWDNAFYCSTRVLGSTDDEFRLVVQWSLSEILLLLVSQAPYCDRWFFSWYCLHSILGDGVRAPGLVVWGFCPFFSGIITQPTNESLYCRASWLCCRIATHGSRTQSRYCLEALGHPRYPLFI